MSEKLPSDQHDLPNQSGLYKGRIGGDEITKKYQGTTIGLNGDYKMMPDLRIAAEKAGQGLIKHAEDNGIDLLHYGFDINGDGKVGVQEAASGCMALALSHEKREWRGKKDQVVSTFETGHFEISGILKDKHWRVAEQILGDNWPSQVKRLTNTFEADRAFIGSYAVQKASEDPEF